QAPHVSPPSLAQEFDPSLRSRSRRRAPRARREEGRRRRAEQLGMFRADLATFIGKNLVADGRTQISDTTPLIEEGSVDSMGLMQIVTFLEERTSLRISDDDVTPDHFETVAAIGRLVEQIGSRRAKR